MVRVTGSDVLVVPGFMKAGSVEPAISGHAGRRNRQTVAIRPSLAKDYGRPILAVSLSSNVARSWSSDVTGFARSWQQAMPRRTSDFKVI